MLFLSYSREDDAHARALLPHLDGVARRHHVDVFKDDLSILAGDDWQAKLEHALDTTSVMVVLVSARSITSKWCEREWKRAFERGRRVIPVQLTDAYLPADHPLRDAQFANLDNPIVVTGSFLERVAKDVAARLDAALAAEAEAAKSNAPTTEGARTDTDGLPLLPPDGSTPSLHPPADVRWLFLSEAGGQLAATWRESPAGPPLRTDPLDRATLDAALRIYGELDDVRTKLADGPRITAALLDTLGKALGAWLLPDDHARAEAIAPWSVHGRPVRLRVVNEVPSLSFLPWRLLRDRDTPLVAEGGWTVELSTTAADLVDVRTLPSARMLIIAPFDDRDPDRGARWLTEAVQGWVRTRLSGSGPEVDGTPSDWLTVARTEAQIKNAGPRAFVLVLADVAMDAAGELSVRLQTADGAAAPLALTRLAGWVGSDRQALYLDATDVRRGSVPLTVPPALASQWPCVLTRGAGASPRQHAEALLGWLDAMLVGGRDPVMAAHHRPPDAALVSTFTAGGVAALSLLRLTTRYRDWTVDSAALQHHQVEAEIHIDRTAQRAEALLLAQAVARDTRWCAQHALVLGRASERLDLVGGQITRHIQRNFTQERSPDVAVIVAQVPGLPVDRDVEAALLDVLPPPNGRLEDALAGLVAKAPRGARVLVVVDWGLVGDGVAADRVRALKGEFIRDWIALSHRRLAPICQSLRDRLGFLHLLSAEADASLRERVDRTLTDLIPYGDRHPGVTARLLPPLSQVTREDVRNWLAERTPWAPRTWEAIAAAIIARTQGDFQLVAQALAQGRRFGFDNDLRRGRELLDTEARQPTLDW
jgi:hypothetical protein